MIKDTNCQMFYRRLENQITKFVNLVDRINGFDLDESLKNRSVLILEFLLR